MLTHKYYNGVQFREDIAFRVREDSIEVSGKQGFEIKGLSYNEIQVFKKLKRGLKVNELKIAVKLPKINKIFYLLDNNHYLQHHHQIQKETLECRQLKWMSINNADPTKELQNLSQKKIGILGCGGTGSIIAMNLVRSGIKNLILVDGAKVDLPDMNRQLAYDLEDIGSFKVDSLKSYLDKTAYGLEIEAHRCFIENDSSLSEIMKGIDLLISCADKPFGKIHQIVTKTALKNNCAVIFGGVGIESGTVGPLLVSKKAKSNYLQSVTQATQLWAGDHTIMQASLSHTNSIISTLMGLEVFNFLRSTGSSTIENKSFDFNFMKAMKERQVDWENMNE